MAQTEPCPRCRQGPVLGGRVFAFYPSMVWDHRPIAGAAVPGEARACLSCGHLWTHVEPSHLRRYIRDYTGELGRQYLDELERGPYRDLSESDLAREIGDQVAELDALARGGSAGKVVRRYRELRGVTWDQALKEVTKWADLTRPEKLALFGWIPKKAKEPFDEFF